MRLVPPAPELRFGLCTDCRVPPVIAGDGDLKVCPRCYAVLWHKDYTGEERRRRLEAQKLAAEREAQRRAVVKAAKESSHQIIPKPPDETPS